MSELLYEHGKAIGRQIIASTEKVTEKAATGAARDHREK
jgi:hypothetical protein